MFSRNKPKQQQLRPVDDAAPDPKFTTNLSEWMSLMPDHLRDIPLIRLAIPGSHDSMSYGITRGAAVAPDAESVIARLNCILPCVVRRWARTQDLNVTQQLHAGIRYFDLRISRRSKERRFYFVHGLFAEPICEPLTEMVRFLAVNRGEMVVLDCQHFYAFGAEDYRKVAGEISALFGDMVWAPKDGELQRLTLNAAREMGKQVVIIFRNYDHLPADFWPDDAWPTPWPDEIRVGRLQAFLEDSLQQRPYASGYVTQCVLTPPAHFILPRFYSSLRHSCAETVRRELFDWLRAQRPGPYQPGRDPATVNVFIADFVDLNAAEFCREVVRLNAKILPADYSKI